MECDLAAAPGKECDLAAAADVAAVYAAFDARRSSARSLPVASAPRSILMLSATVALRLFEELAK
jgi:hypothetical protein